MPTPKAVNQIVKEDALFDTAVKADDMDGAQYVLDEYAKKEGYAFHRGADPKDAPAGVSLFSDDPSAIAQYGDKQYLIKKTDLPDVGDDIVDFAERHYSIGPEEAAELVRPDDIVDSAGAWDDPDFMNALWDSGLIDDVQGFKTGDGAITFPIDDLKVISGDASSMSGKRISDQLGVKTKLTPPPPRS